jgi:hypothetical protein
VSAPQVEHVPHLLQRFTAFEQRVEQATVLVDQVVDQGKTIGRHTPGDAARLRGIPVVGVPGGRGGHIAGTNPAR